MSNHEVGFGKPPKHTRFKPGKSGNPAGRPKGRVPITQLLERYLNTKMTVTANGKQKIVTRREALIMSLVRDAVNGKDKVRKEVFDLLLILEAKMSPETHDAVSALQDDVVINHLLRRRGVEVPLATTPPPLPKARVKIKIVKAEKKEGVK